MLFSNELNYWVIKKNAKKYLLLRMRAPYQNLSQNLGWRRLLRECSNNRSHLKTDKLSKEHDLRGFSRSITNL
ncbi:hypothetical protein [Leptospira borgpetersenii]|uniref:hypothetical protein n=1 Tax=Leptospira borgpetersenii TaxID=174 RepID=UPI00352CA1C5